MTNAAGKRWAETTKVSVVDWEELKADYRCGQMSLRQLAEKYGCTRSRISMRAKKEGWEQDKTKEVNERTRAALIEATAQAYENEAIAQGLTEGAALRPAVEAAAEMNLRIIMSHRKMSRRLKDAVEGMTEDLIDSSEKANNIRAEVNRLLVMPDEDGEPILSQDRGQKIYSLLQDAASFSGRSTSLQKIVSSLETLVRIERQAYNIGAEENTGNGGWEGILEEVVTT